MANSSSWFHHHLLIIPCLLIVAFIVSSLSSVVEATGNHHEMGQWSWMAPANTGGGECRGSIAECMAAGGEFEMDTESNRRILATTDYISYGALQRNTVPCSQRGASYYNCKAGAQANPYSRGCSAITRCRS